MRADRQKGPASPLDAYDPFEAGFGWPASDNTVASSGFQAAQQLGRAPRVARLVELPVEPAEPNCRAAWFFVPGPNSYSKSEFSLVYVRVGADWPQTMALQCNVGVLDYTGPLRDVPISDDAQARALRRSHRALWGVLVAVAKNAALKVGAELRRIDVFPDFSHEFDASHVTVFEAVLQDLGQRRDSYWAAVESQLAARLPLLAIEEQRFFEESVSFEVCEE